MKTLTCKFLQHRGKENIALYFEHDNEFVRCLRKMIGLFWSKQNRCWYCESTRNNVEHITKIGTEHDYNVNNIHLKSAGKKDRYVGLSILLLDVLHAYIMKSVARSKLYVFENPVNAGQPYSIRSAKRYLSWQKTGPL